MRGVAADITGLGVERKFFFCNRGFSCAAYDAAGPYGQAKWYAHGAEIRWVENGIHYSLQGPYRPGTLQTLAEQITFLPKL